MKKIIIIMMLQCSISSHCFAQATYDPIKMFELQNNPFQRSFFFDLGKKEKMQLELYELRDLEHLLNIDSIIDLFVHDLEKVRDSIPPEIYSRYIEYSIDAPNFRRLNISKQENENTGFVITDGEASLLKVTQDTIVINGTIPGVYDYNLFHKNPQLHHYRISFFLNELDMLSIHRNYLNTKIQSLHTNMNSKWGLEHDGYMHLRTQPGIYSKAKRGYVLGGKVVGLKPTIDIQNYKSNFVPSATGGLAIVTNKDLVHREYFSALESHFLFGKNDNGETKTYVNWFLVIGYGQSTINPSSKRNGILYPYISLGYLVKRKGDYYDKHSFKLGIGQFNLVANYTKIEPVIYFHDFFKGVSPSLRITQHF